jgi:hypothetical protein
MSKLKHLFLFLTGMDQGEEVYSVRNLPQALQKQMEDVGGRERHIEVDKFFLF